MTRSTSKLRLRTETLKPLTDDALGRAVGGFIMRDTVIIPTGRVVDAGSTEACPLTIDIGRP